MCAIFLVHVFFKRLNFMSPKCVKKIKFTKKKKKLLSVKAFTPLQDEGVCCGFFFSPDILDVSFTSSRWF